MPIYEFKCVNCNKIFELLAVKSEDSVNISCPHCKGEHLERVMSRVSINASGSDRGHSPSVTERSCSGGSCQTITLPGHAK